jgi:hypothetical protein
LLKVLVVVEVFVAVAVTLDLPPFLLPVIVKLVVLVEPLFVGFVELNFNVISEYLV